MLQPLGRNTRISFEERANYKIWQAVWYNNLT